jgi:CheY-like chemotaxis protein
MVEFQLFRVIQEALTNSRKHSGAHTLRVIMGLDGNKACITITDDGDGFDADQLKSSGSSHFGLIFMQERMEQIGGSLKIDSIPGGGTVLSLDVPIREKQEGNVMRVLLVDDNRLMLEGLQNLLEVHNIEVAGVAFNGMESIELARDLQPDVILMDIRMPRCDGLTATRLIKAEMPELKIIMLTTSTDDDDLFEAIKSGAYGFLLKSIDTHELVEALNQVQEGTPPFSPGLACQNSGGICACQ